MIIRVRVFSNSLVIVWNGRRQTTNYRADCHYFYAPPSLTSPPEGQGISLE